MNTKHIKGYFHRKRKQKQFHVDAAVEKDPASSPGLLGVVRMAPDHLKLELRSPPVTPLGVVADRIARSHADPLRNRSDIDENDSLYKKSQDFQAEYKRYFLSLLFFIKGKR